VGATAFEPVDVPLSSLNRFRQDPAFRNFMDKTKRPPGATLRRPPVGPDRSQEGR
jgi:hypothetical protein